ncbi:hypothetical protein [Candidatus Lucifugimonas marina]|uniref:Uncharacterized protein n=1 Tax=Candidatus Lucifugimonas marina TaxID=3038979 RepID=A0AAJ5ZGR0_9CHLR|nr:hypothetical protein [SAR202 cluster bacterium JH702]MDG0869294.1 hypothetical protein [SAR202 cluster bacterium JH639]WFG36696.1 hypothetical protein GKN94_13755 [SAR202 cluster bacterium JH545]WFG40630.1 hypothetical protein GKO48_13800 [SAR202 cluster bacterium JH1073]
MVPPDGGDDGGVDLLDDIFADDESEESARLAAFADLEKLTMIEVAAETEAVLEELKIRQGG